MFPGEDGAGFFAHFIELLRRIEFLVAGDLEHTVTGGIHNGVAGADVLLAQLIQNGGTAGGSVAQRLGADGSLKGIHHFRRKAFRIQWKGLFQLNAHQFPVAGGGILASGGFHGAAIHASAFGGHRIAHAINAAKAHGLHPRQAGSLLFINMAKGIGTRVAIGSRVRQSASAHAVQYDQNDALFQ